MQYEQLNKTLDFFSLQSFPHDHFEIIVVNDGTPCFNETSILESYKGMNLTIITISHSGSGVARNAGAQKAKGKYLVFCDADRVPDPFFLDGYYSAIQNNNSTSCVFQGRVQECFATDIYACDEVSIARFSRDNQYYKKIMNIYDGEKSDSPIRWASFLVGNACVPKALFMQIGGFDPQFQSWGFEHFDLAVRMMEANAIFISVNEAKNYHFPHSKGRDEYIALFWNSAKIMNKKYENYNNGFDHLVDYLCGKMSLKEFEIAFAGQSSHNLTIHDEIYYRL